MGNRYRREMLTEGDIKWTHVRKEQRRALKITGSKV